MAIITTFRGHLQRPNISLTNIPPIPSDKRHASDTSTAKQSLVFAPTIQIRAIERCTFTFPAKRATAGKRPVEAAKPKTTAWRTSASSTSREEAGHNNNDEEF